MTPALSPVEPGRHSRGARSRSCRLRVGPRSVARARAVLDPPARREPVRVDRPADSRRRGTELARRARHHARGGPQGERTVSPTARPGRVGRDDAIVIGAPGAQPRQLLRDVDDDRAVAGTPRRRTGAVRGRSPVLDVPARRLSAGVHAPGHGGARASHRRGRAGDGGGCLGDRLRRRGEGETGNDCDEETASHASESPSQPLTGRRVTVNDP